MIKTDDQKFVKKSKPPQIQCSTVQCNTFCSVQYNDTFPYYRYHTLCSLSIMRHLLKQRHKFTVIHLDTLNVTVVSKDEKANQDKDWKKK